MWPQAQPEHSMVLRPNSASESCSLSLEFTQPFDRSVAPSLVIEMANPRILVLFRQALIQAKPEVAGRDPSPSAGTMQLGWPGLCPFGCFHLLPWGGIMIEEVWRAIALQDLKAAGAWPAAQVSA